MTDLLDHLASQMAGLRQAGTYKEELVLESPQGPRVRVGGRDVVMLTSNNYLGFANHPRMREAQKKAVDRWGGGLASVRFICGTQALHRDLEAEIASFFGKDDAILYMSCWNANEGLFAAVLDEPDGLYSDELNHASIIDGVRLSKAKRFRVPHNDPKALAAMLAEDDDLALPPHHDRRRLLDGGRGGGSARARPRSATPRRRSSSWTTRTRPASSARPAAARRKSRAFSIACPSSPARSARRWARRPAAS